MNLNEIRFVKCFMHIEHIQKCYSYLIMYYVCDLRGHSQLLNSIIMPVRHFLGHDYAFSGGSS